MSFHHAQPHKGDSSSNHNPAEGLSQNAETEADASLVEDSEVKIVSAYTECDDEYDEEARFELLSAYLDNEVTAEERQLVAQWLMDDPNTQQMYQRLLMLRQAIRTAPMPVQPPLQVPKPPQKPWKGLFSGKLYPTLVCIIAISILSGLGQWGTLGGRQQLQEAWQFIKSLPQGSLLDLASTVSDLSINAQK